MPGEIDLHKAVVVGCTGAVGAQVLGHLLIAGHWQHVVALGRRQAPVPDSFKAEDMKGKLEQGVINMDNLETEGAPYFQGADSVFCCLGTTRKDAGSAAAFRKVDLEYIAATACAAKAGGAKHIALVSSQGANANLWANDWSIFHGLLYAQVKGLAEQATIKAGIPSTSIFRPGLLERGAKARGVESAFKNVVSSIPVSGLGQLMVLDAIKAAEKRKERGDAPGGGQETKFYEMNELLKALRGLRTPKAA